MEKKSKYHAKQITIDNLIFDSKAEGTYYLLLKEKLDKDEIKSFELQPRYELQPTFMKNGKTYRKIEYVADFKVIHQDGTVEVIDIKGFETPDFKIKRKMFERVYPDLTLTLLKYVKKYGGWISTDEWKRLKKEEKKNGK